MKPAATSDDHAWADYMIYMEAGADVVSLPAPSAKREVAQPSIAWGLIGAILVGLLALWISVLPVWPFTMSNGRHPVDSTGLAIVLGMLLGNFIRIPLMFQPGLEFTVKRVLPVGIILLGARINMAELVKVGTTGIVMSVICVLLALSVLWFLGRQLKLGRKLATLLGIGTAVCGGSAIVAAAPVIEAEDRDIVFSVAVVTLLGTVAMLLYPVIGHMLEMHSRAFGIWSGLTLYQTPQVVAAGFSYSREAGEVATIVKLARVCLLAPVVFVLGLMYARSKTNGKGGTISINYRSLIPTFVIGLVAFVALRSLGLLPNITINLPAESAFGASAQTFDLVNTCQFLSTLFIVISMAAAGADTKFEVFRKIGVAPLVAATIGFLVMTSAILLLVKILPT